MTISLPYRRALVTGCAGFIGSHLAETLLALGCEVVGVDCFNDNYARRLKLANLRHLDSWDRFEFVPIDLAEGDLVELIDDSEVVFHLAAEPGVRTSWGTRYRKYLRNNVLATQNLLESLRTLTPRRLVYASSSSVYGDTNIIPTPEEARLLPRSPYGQTKASVELLCNLYHANFGVDAVGLRYFTVYGPRQRPDMAFYRICTAALSGERFTVFGDGSQSRDFTYVSDIVDATIAASVSTLGSRVYNIGGGSPAQLREVIDLVQDLATTEFEVTFESAEHGDVHDTSADTTRAAVDLGLEPKVTLATGVAAEFEWLAHAVESG